MDTAISRTDDDALAARASAVKVGYWQDDFLRYFVKDVERKAPVINRGTFIRTWAIDQIVEHFLLDASETNRKQIISLGAGSDTRAFRIMKIRKQDFHYHEVDFPHVCQRKALTMTSKRELKQLLGDSLVVDARRGSIKGHTYSLHPMDLKDLGRDNVTEQQDHHTRSAGQDSKDLTQNDTHSKKQDKKDLTLTNAQEQTGNTGLEGVDITLETLIISEVCLIYMDLDAADRILTWSKRFPHVAMLIYEPIRGDDAFGKMMVRNLALRGLELKTLQAYPTLSAQSQRLSQAGYAVVHTCTMDDVFEKWLSADQKAHISQLERLDEMEEWILLAEHYCIAIGMRGTPSAGALFHYLR